MNIREQISETYPDLLVIEQNYLDPAILGVVTRMGLEAVCYDENKVIQLLMENDHMTEEEAIEYMEYNMKGAWVGETTPVFLTV